MRWITFWTSASPPKHPGLKKIPEYRLRKFQTFQPFGISEQLEIVLRDFRQVGVISFCGRPRNVHFWNLAAVKSWILWFLRLMDTIFFIDEMTFMSYNSCTI